MPIDHVPLRPTTNPSLGVLGQKSNGDQVADELFALGRRQMPKAPKLGACEPHAGHLGKFLPNRRDHGLAPADVFLAVRERAGMTDWHDLS